MILDHGFNLTLRPMKYPTLYERYKDAIKNTWTVEEVNLSYDQADLAKMSKAESHLVKRLVAFFATGDSIVANNLVLSLYKHINSPEARMYLSRQLYEEALHVQFYLTLLDTYLPDEKERAEAFAAIENVPSIKRKAAFCAKYETIHDLAKLRTESTKKEFLLNLICFAACIEGLFFFAAFAYIYFLRSKGLLHGLASGTNWVFRDESCHMEFAFEIIDIIKKEEPELWDDELKQQVVSMMKEAVRCEMAFAADALQFGVVGMSGTNMKQYLGYCADQRLKTLGIDPIYNTKNPFDFMELQDVQEFTNFFERKVSAYQMGITGEVRFDEDF